MRSPLAIHVRPGAFVCLGMLLLSCTAGPEEAWMDTNRKIVEKLGLKGRGRTLPAVPVRPKLEPGAPSELAALDGITLASGVTAKVVWGRGVLLEVVEMAPGATYPDQELTEELITVVREGSARCRIAGEEVELTKDAVLYLEAGARRSLAAGPDGWKAIEVYSPVRAEHLRMAGASVPEAAGFPDQGVEPSLQPGVVYNLNEIQFTPVTDPEPSKTYQRSHAMARLVWGRNAQLSFVRMDPGSEFPMHIHPEDQLLLTLRGGLEQGIMESTYRFGGERNNVVFLPGGMAHSAKLSEFGADQLDVFWPVRPDYVERAKQQTARYEQVVAPGVKPVKLAEGFTFAEGPTWLKGRLYFSDMYFRDHRNGDWTGDPAKSRLIRMEADGKWTVLSKGMQTNGTIASRDGNLLVCDMFGHRVLEVDPNSGQMRKTVLSHVNGAAIDGPNDLVMDAKGGIYVTDPQFTPEAKKSQPGKQVYYVAPGGEAKVVIPAGEYAMPNGIEVSPDGKTLYVNNTWFQPGENYVWAYDIQPDGSLANKRPFAVLNLTPEVLSAAKPEERFDSRADGMAMDTTGRIYVATLSGVQIFDPAGIYLGTIWCPQYPVSCTFGGPDRSTLYMVGESSAWSIPTKVTGYRVPEGLD